MKKGDEVRVVQPTVQGPIVGTRYNEEILMLEHRVQWTGPDGEQHERWFSEDELEVTQ